jgi:hypothetical protein
MTFREKIPLEDISLVKHGKHNIHCNLIFSSHCVRRIEVERGFNLRNTLMNTVAPFGWNYKPAEKHCWLIFCERKILFWLKNQAE